ATSYFYHDARLMAQYARMLHRLDDERRFTDLAETLKSAFNKNYFHEEEGYYDNGTQTSTILPLAFGFVPERYRERVFEHLVHHIVNESSNHLATGSVGVQWLMRVLTENGRADLAYELASQNSYPSWGYMVRKGATTIWELWNGDTAGTEMNSGNHVMLVGDVVIWLYESLAGIKSDLEQPGFKHIIMHPEPIDELEWVEASHRSRFGLIASRWRKSNEIF